MILPAISVAGSGLLQLEPMLYRISACSTPATQSQKFDKEGKFIKKYVKELKNVPEKLIHQPEKMTQAEQEEYG